MGLAEPSWINKLLGLSSQWDAGSSVIMGLARLSWIMRLASPSWIIRPAGPSRIMRISVAEVQNPLVQCDLFSRIHPDNEIYFGRTLMESGINRTLLDNEI